MNVPFVPSRRLFASAIFGLAAVAAVSTSSSAFSAKKFTQLAKALSVPAGVRAEQLPVETVGGTNEDGMPNAVRVPGIGAAGTPICGIINGKFECITMVSITCPGSIELVQEGSNTTFSCDVSCNPPEPDSEGYCECDIDYGSCR